MPSAFDGYYPDGYDDGDQSGTHAGKQPRMTYERKCSHSKTFKTRCIECELIMAREAVAHAKDNLDKYGKLVVKLEAEQRMQVALSHS